MSKNSMETNDSRVMEKENYENILSSYDKSTDTLDKKDFYITMEKFNKEESFLNYKKLVTANFIINSLKILNHYYCRNGTYKILPAKFPIPIPTQKKKNWNKIPKNRNLFAYNFLLDKSNQLIILNNDVSLQLEHQIRLSIVHYIKMRSLNDYSTFKLESPSKEDIVQFSLDLASFNILILTNDLVNNIPKKSDPKGFHNKYGIDPVKLLQYHLKVSSILQSFDERVKLKLYPNLPSQSECFKNAESTLKFSKKEQGLFHLLKKREEFYANAFNMANNNINFSHIFLFMKDFSKLFNKYYNTEPVLVSHLTPHLFPKMFAQIHLYKAIEIVFRDFLKSILFSCTNNNDCQNFVNFK